MQKETILYGTEIGKPEHLENIITVTTKTGADLTEHLKQAKEWATANGFDRFRVWEFIPGTKPNFGRNLLNI